MDVINCLMDVIDWGFIGGFIVGFVVMQLAFYFANKP